MDVEKGRRKSKGLTTLEKVLIFLFVALTGVCIGLVVVYFLDRPADESTDTEDILSGCGGPQQLMGESGTFTSFNYPSDYDNGKSCVWHISVEPGKVIHLWFQEFAVEETMLCTSDFVTLRDSLGVIGKYCGYTKPEPVVTLTNQLTVYFDTNEAKTDHGFKAHFKAVAPELAHEIAGAGGFLQGDQGDLMTPGQSYPNGALYQWRITVPEGERVRLTFNSFDLVREACADFVQVIDGSTAGSSLMGKFCGGSIPDPVMSSRNTMVVRFKSDHVSNSKGFKATFTKSSIPVTTRPPTTAGPITPKPSTTPRPPTTAGPTTPEPSTTPVTSRPTETTPAPTTTPPNSGRKGVVQSPGFPNGYPAHQNSTWKFTVARGFLVRLQLTDLAIPGKSGKCEEDKLIVSDDYGVLATLCGYLLPPVMVTGGESLYLTFQSDSRLSDRGFSARWEATYPEDVPDIQGCGFSSKEETGVMKSQNWPLNYKAGSVCTWSITPPPGKNITLKFTDFDLQPQDVISSQCTDRVMVYEVDGATNQLLQERGPFCGKVLPPSLQAKGNRLVVRFLSDMATEKKGFRAYWTTDATQPAPTEPPTQLNPWDNIPIDWPDKCGKPAIPPTVMSRIVNGEPAKPHSWPWQVSMQVWPPSQKDPKFSHICGGTLIHKNWVLTAAHCFMNYADELPRWQMCLGKHNLTYTENSERCFGVAGIYAHESFKYPNIPLEFDIALVRLNADVEHSDEISYACLPSEEEILGKGKICYASGWGDETAAEALNQVALPIIPYETCKGMDYWWFQMMPSMICGGYTLPDELQSVCQGDSGGPLVCQDVANGTWEVHGITSYGPIGCIMDKKPSVFTRASAYLPWINNIIRRDLYNTHASGCGGPKELIATNGIVSSMGYPGVYSSHARCEWNIRVPQGKVVQLQFQNFSLEESPMCSNDKVTVMDRAGSLGTFCSHVAPKTLVSDGDILQISFSSNDKVVDTGFTATWTAVDPKEAPCGGVLSSTQGELRSPGWPGDYQDQTVCTWRIDIPSAVNVTVGFTHMELQAVDAAGECVDYVEVLHGQSMIPVGRFCGFAVPPSLTIPGSSAVVRFLSDAAGRQQGFRGYWTNDPSKIPTLPPPPPKPWDNITISWPEDCGNPAVKPNIATPRVVNGVEARPHSWPWQVSMQGSLLLPIFPFSHGCGGSLIHEEWILTAAHCFMLPLNQPNQWRMCLGKHHMNSSMDVPSAETCYKVDAIIRHEGFVYEQDNSDISNDIALVHLSQRVNMSREVSPICLPKPGALMPAGSPCFVTGWGDEKGSMLPQISEKLNQAALPVVDFQTCSQPDYWWDVLRPSMICAGYESPDELKSACQGDSGGPFSCTPVVNSTWEVHGIVSFGPQGCIMDKKPSVFTRVSAFNDWILDNIKKFMFDNGKN